MQGQQTLKASTMQRTAITQVTIMPQIIRILMVMEHFLVREELVTIMATYQSIPELAIITGLLHIIQGPMLVMLESLTLEMY
jgi:hypothetical protein